MNIMTLLVNNNIDIFNVNNVPPVADDQCIICLEKLNNKPIYSLPECNHTYHQNCIMHWFRQGSSKCPLCNNNGAIAHNSENWISIREKYHILRKFSRKKNAPTKLKNYIIKLRKQEQELKHISKQLSTFKKERVGNFGELFKEFRKLQSKRRRKFYKIRQMKNILGQSNQIIPIIIVEKRIL